MADFTALKTAIQQHIAQNGNKEITGNLLQTILLAMVQSMGDNAINALVSSLASEVTNRQNADGILQSSIASEAARALAAETASATFDNVTKHVVFKNAAGVTLYQYDASSFIIDGMVQNVEVKDVVISGETVTCLVISFNTDAGKQDINIPLTLIFDPENYYTKTQIDNLLSPITSAITVILSKLGSGALYAGYATTSTTPAASTGQPVFYVATKSGTYTNFLSNGDIPITLAKDGIYFLVSGVDDDDWNAEPMLQLDDVPTASSNNAVKSGGVAEELALGAVYDVSAHNSGETFASLSALLNDANLDTLIPTSVRKGGMSVKFVQSSDNKYVQYRLMSQAFSTTESDWQGISFDKSDFNNPSDAQKAKLTTVNSILDIAKRFVYTGIAEPSTEPTDLTNNIFCFAKKAGTYTNLGGFTLTGNELCVLKRWNGIWVKEIVSIESEYANNVLGMLLLSDAFSLKAAQTTIIENKYISNTGIVTNGNGFRICVCQVSAGWYILSGSRFNANHANYVFAADSELNDITTVITETEYINGVSIVSVPQEASYIAWSEYPSVETRQLHNCQEGLVSALNYENTIGQYISNIPLSNYTKRYIVNGNVTATSYDLRVSDIIPIIGKNLTLTRPTDAVWSQSCGYRFLAEDGETVVAYGVLSGNDETITINVPEQAFFFQLSESASFIDRIKMVYYAPNTVNGIKEEFERKFLSQIYRGGNLPSTKYIYNGEIHNDGQYNLYCSSAIKVKNSQTIKIQCSNGTYQSVCGWRFIAEDGVTVVGYGANPNGVAEFQLSVPDGAVYFQFSDAKDVVLNTTILATIITDEAQDFDSIKNFKQKVKSKSASGEDVTISVGDTEMIVAETIACRDWLSAVTISGNPTDVTLTFGGVFGKSSLRITQTELIEKEISHNLTKTHQHNLTLGSVINLILTIKDDKAYVLLATNASQYKTELSYFYGTDGMSVTNNSATSIVVKRGTIDLTPTANATVLLCGDSYAFEAWGVDENVKKYGWTSLLKEMGCKFGNIGFPGAKGEEVYHMLTSLISSGAKPSVIIWALGMNDGADTSQTQGSTLWKRYIDNACALANSIGALFIPCTIPSVPNYNNDGKNYVIRNNYERYIDFDNALTGKTPWAQDGSNWISGYLSSDNVHPTANGFFAMCSQAVMDAPELFCK